MSSDTAPDRRIQGLKPRPEAPLSRLIKAERDAQPSAAPEPDAVRTRAPGAGARRAPRPAGAPAPAPEAPKRSMTVYIDGGLRQRSRAAFQATRTSESDESYSDMIAKAIEAEVARREAAYNDGRPFAGGAAPLPSGRPLQG